MISLLTIMACGAILLSLSRYLAAPALVLKSPTLHLQCGCWKVTYALSSGNAPDTLSPKRFALSWSVLRLFPQNIWILNPLSLLLAPVLTSKSLSFFPKVGKSFTSTTCVRWILFGADVRCDLSPPPDFPSWCPALPSSAFLSTTGASPVTIFWSLWSWLMLTDPCPPPSSCA